VRLFAEGLDEPLTVDGDATRIEQIAWNLLSNALKFSPRAARSGLACAGARRCAVLEVSDAGRGIAAEFLPHVFEMFKQAGSATKRGEGGLGIGLAMVKSLSELHGGRVEVESAARARARPSASSCRCTRAATSRRSSRRLGGRPDEPRRPARAAGRRHRRRARDLRLPARARRLPGELRLERARGARADRAQDFDLLISDVGMPQMDGYELIAELRTASAPPACRRSPSPATAGPRT
jgi:two-component system CheB/CheR fusion protein